MTTCFTKADRQPDFGRYREQWENAALLAALTHSGLDEDERAALIRNWIQGSFNGAAFGVYDLMGLGQAALDWVQAGPTQFDLLYTSIYGVCMPLGRVYQQPDGSWGALVIAGVKEDVSEAMAAAEWAIAKLAG